MINTSIDPRLYQIGALSGLVTYGVWVRDLPISLTHMALIGVGGLSAQWIGDRWRRHRPFEWMSVAITVLSLTLLLRTSEPWFGVLAGFVAIGSKFVFTWGGKHLFNPANLALTLGIVVTDAVWIAPAQWGNSMLFALLLAGAGLLVVTRAARWDVTGAFIGIYVAAICLRGLWLGDPGAVMLHPLHNGAFWLFAFFMISDPRSTPDSRSGRVVFAGVAALISVYAQFWGYSPNGLLYGLFGAALLTPWLDKSLPGPRYRWSDSHGVLTRSQAFPIASRSLLVTKVR